MRHLIFAAALMTGLISSANAQSLSGNELYQFCNDKTNYFNHGRCFGFVDGVSALMINVHYFSKNICSPAGITLGQLVDIVKKWLNENPEKRHVSASRLVEIALQDAWPCPKKKP